MTIVVDKTRWTRVTIACAACILVGIYVRSNAKEWASNRKKWSSQGNVTVEYTVPLDHPHHTMLLDVGLVLVNFGTFGAAMLAVSWLLLSPARGATALDSSVVAPPSEPH